MPEPTSSRSRSGEAGAPVAFHLPSDTDHVQGKRGEDHDPYPGDSNGGSGTPPARSPTRNEGTFSSGGSSDQKGSNPSNREPAHDAENDVVVQEVLEAPATNVVETHHDNALVAFIKRLKGAGKPGPVWFAWSWDSVPAFVFTAIALMVLAVIEAFGLQPHDLGLLSYLPSFGASCCLIMCLLTSPGAQPRALIGTHIVGAFLGVSWAHITKSLPNPLGQQLACAFAVSMITVLMMMTATFQPSASASTCLAAFHLYGQMKDQGFMFLVAPAIVGPCVLVFLGWVLNNTIPWRHSYPVWW